MAAIWAMENFTVALARDSLARWRAEWSWMAAATDCRVPHAVAWPAALYKSQLRT
jgi:hypothetical protein